jgi:hypothetical protein
MWINEVAPERVEDLLDNYRQALTVFGKGSESASGNGMPRSERNFSIVAERQATERQATQELNATNKESVDSRHYFAEPGEADWGC